MLQRLDVQLLEVERRRFEDDLELIVVLQAHGVFAVTTVTRTAAWLHVGGVPALGTDCPQEGGGVKGARAHFHVERLDDDAALFCPEMLQ